VGAFRDALDRKQELAPAPGHPVHTYMADNKVIAGLATQLAEMARKLASGDGGKAELLPTARAVLDRYEGIDNHYKRKENQLFPMLERHGITGPSQVMRAFTTTSARNGRRRARRWRATMSRASPSGRRGSRATWSR